MTDIVERLRALADKVDDQGEIYLAVCEIERLRKDARAYANVQLSEENDRLIDEIERLQMRDEMASERVGELEREIERLRDALSNCRKLREAELTQYNRSQR